MISVPRGNISRLKGSNDSLTAPQSDEVMIAMARIFSGSLGKGSKLYCMKPKYNPNLSIESQSQFIEELVVSEIFEFRGKDLLEVKESKAGNIVGISGLEGSVFKTGTLSSTPFCPSFDAQVCSSAPILRVAVEPIDPNDMKKLEMGLKLLNQADPIVEIRIQETGENVLATAGELHLEVPK